MYRKGKMDTPYMRLPPKALLGVVLSSILARIRELRQKFGDEVPIYVSKMDVKTSGFRQVREDTGSFMYMVRDFGALFPTFGRRSSAGWKCDSVGNRVSQNSTSATTARILSEVRQEPRT